MLDEPQSQLLGAVDAHTVAARQRLHCFQSVVANAALLLLLLWRGCMRRAARLGDDGFWQGTIGGPRLRLPDVRLVRAASVKGS